MGLKSGVDRFLWLMRYVLLFLISCFSCLASTVTGPIADLAGLGFNPRVEFWPLSTPYNSGNTNVVGPMKSVQAVSGNFSQVLLAGRYLVKFPPTTNSFIIIVPNDNSTYSLSTLSSNVASVSSITSTYFITSNQFASALTNQDTRNVTFLGTVASSGFQGDGNGLTELDADNLIYGSIPIGRISDGLITSNKLDATAYVAFMGGGSGSSIAAGTNIVTVTNGSLVTVHGTANVTQAGLAAGSYATKGLVRLIHNGVSTNSFTTLTAAKSAATSGDLIEVYPGTYTENDLLKNGVNWDFKPGAVVFWNETATSNGRGIFDDRGLGAVQCTVFGSGVFKWSGGTNLDIPNPDSIGAIVTTNSATAITIKGQSLTASGFAAYGKVAIYNCRSNYMQFDVVNSLYPDGTGVGASGLQFPTDSGIYWELGDCRFNINQLITEGNNGYAIWGAEPGDGSVNHTNDLWYSGQTVKGKYYTDCFSSNYRVWMDVQEWSADFNVPGGSSLAVPFAAFGGGKHYLKVSKLNSPHDYAINIGGKHLSGTNSPQVWITAQKITGARGWYSDFSDSTANVASKVYLSAQQFEQVANGETWVCGFVSGNRQPQDTNALLVVNGGTAICNGLGIKHSGGLWRFNGMALDTSSGTQPPVFVTSTNLHLSGMRLVGPLSTNSIGASTAKEVGVYWSAGRQTNSANITLKPSAGFTVDANTR